MRPPLLERLHAAPSGLARGVEANAKGELIRILARVLEQLVGEIATLTTRIQHDVEQLAAEAGVCPVTYESGNSRGVAFRWACNHRLRGAVTT